MVGTGKDLSSKNREGSFLDDFLLGDRRWGLLRLFFVGIGVVTLFLASFLVKDGWRDLVAPYSAGLMAFMAGARYLQDIYELDKVKNAFHYLFASFFGIHYPELNIYAGKKGYVEDETNMLDVIGGPGYVNISPGNAVLLEGRDAPVAILTNGRHFVPSFQTIQPIALEDQYGELDGITAMTRDGFDVKIGRTRFRFRLLAGPISRSRLDPYPYSDDAVYDMVYNRTVSEQGLGEWGTGVSTEISKVLTDFINRHTLDQLTAPEESGGDPRGEIQRELRSQSIKDRLHERGTELLSIDIGSFEIPNKQVEQQRLTTWQSKWMGDARLTRSYGEAQRLAYQEIGRAEAQAEMLISIIHGLSDINLRVGTRQSLRDIILVRTAQLLETMGQSLPEEGEPIPSRDSGKKDSK